MGQQLQSVWVCVIDNQAKAFDTKAKALCVADKEIDEVVDDSREYDGLPHPLNKALLHLRLRQRGEVTIRLGKDMFDEPDISEISIQECAIG